MGKVYFNVICEEVEAIGGKIIHMDQNFGDMDEVHKFVVQNLGKYPNAHWELRAITLSK